MTSDEIDKIFFSLDLHEFIKVRRLMGIGGTGGDTRKFAAQNHLKFLTAVAVVRGEDNEKNK